MVFLFQQISPKFPSTTEIFRIPPKSITEMIEISPSFFPPNIFPLKYFAPKLLALNVLDKTMILFADLMYTQQQAGTIDAVFPKSNEERHGLLKYFIKHQIEKHE